MVECSIVIQIGMPTCTPYHQTIYQRLGSFSQSALFWFVSAGSEFIPASQRVLGALLHLVQAVMLLPSRWWCCYKYLWQCPDIPPTLMVQGVPVMIPDLHDTSLIELRVLRWSSSNTIQVLRIAVVIGCSGIAKSPPKNTLCWCIDQHTDGWPGVASKDAWIYGRAAADEQAARFEDAWSFRLDSSSLSLLCFRFGGCWLAGSAGAGKACLMRSGIFGRLEALGFVGECFWVFLPLISWVRLCTLYSLWRLPPNYDLRRTWNCPERAVLSEKPSQTRNRWLFFLLIFGLLRLSDPDTSNSISKDWRIIVIMFKHHCHWTFKW